MTIFLSIKALHLNIITIILSITALSHKKIIIVLFIIEKLLQIQVNSEGSKKHGCQCLPPCDDTNYQIDLESTVPW